MALQRGSKKAAVLALAMTLLPSRRAAMVVAALLLALALMTLVPHAQKPAAPLVVHGAGGGCRRATTLCRGLLPLRPCSHAVPSPRAGNPCSPSSRAAARTCCRVPSPAGNLCLLGFPSCSPPLPPRAAAAAGGKRNRASRSGTADLEPLLRHGTRTDQPVPDHDGTLQAASVDKNLTPLDEVIKFTNTHHTELITAIDAMRAEHKMDMEKIKSEMEKIISGITQHAGELKNLKNEVVRQGTIQRLVICTPLIVTTFLGFFVWMFHDEWMNRAGALVKVWAGEALHEVFHDQLMNRTGALVKVWAAESLYEATGGWFGKKR